MNPARDRPAPIVGGADADLDAFLSERLSEHNTGATPGVAPAQELTVHVLDDAGEIAAGVSGWTWGVAAGMGLVWVRADHRGSGIGSALVDAFESEAASRGSTHVFVSSFTFQAPAFYEARGYRRLFTLESLPTPGQGDVHLRKDLAVRDH